MAKTYSQSRNMTNPTSPLEHLLFICVLFVNWICVKIFSLSIFTDLVDLVFIVPLKILPFATAYIAYKDKWDAAGRKIKNWIKQSMW